jgi:nucleoid-associated protein YgaU
MVFKGSRYTNVEVIQPVRADGKSPRVLALRPNDHVSGVLLHIASEGERLDQLATNFYGEPTKYWLILDANPEVLNPFELLVAGLALKVPQDRIVRS